MAILIQCDLCGRIIGPEEKYHKVSFDEKPFDDLCADCSEELRQFMISKWRGANIKPKAENIIF